MCAVQHANVCVFTLPLSAHMCEYVSVEVHVSCSMPTAHGPLHTHPLAPPWGLDALALVMDVLVVGLAIHM